MSEDNLKSIVKLEVNKLNKRLNEISYDLICDDDVYDYIHKLAIKEKEFGARPIIRIIQNELEDKITDLILNNEYEKEYKFKANVQHGSVVVS